MAIAAVKSMKTCIIILAVSLAACFSPWLQRAQASLEVSAGVSITATAEFYEPLTPCGSWIEVGSYGRCWRPAGVVVGWRPYCNGYWEWTDCGWYWVSDEPWAWACYHYGSWVYDPGYGWVWVPGVEWAPAWVYWRMGGGHIGWAPCGPRGFVVAPSLYVFVESSHFHERVRSDTVVVNNTVIINNTTEIKNTRREKRDFDGRSQTVVINQGPQVDVVEKAAGKKFNAVSVREADRKTLGLVPEKLKQRASEKASNEKSRVIQGEPKPVPGGDKKLPNNVRPNKEAPAEKVIPQPPVEKIVPPAKKELPQDKESQRPKEIVPPPVPPSTPVVPPGNREHKDKGHDKDKDKDRGRGHDNP